MHIPSKLFTTILKYLSPKKNASCCPTVKGCPENCNRNACAILSVSSGFSDILQNKKEVLGNIMKI